MVFLVYVSPLLYEGEFHKCEVHSHIRGKINAEVVYGVFSVCILSPT